MRVNTEVRSGYRSSYSSNVEECGECDGTGLRTMHWLSREDYNRMLELDKRLENAENGIFEPKKKKKAAWVYVLIGFILGAALTNGNTAGAFVGAFLGLAMACK